MSETVKGLKELLKKLDALPVDLTDKIGKTMLANGSEMAQKARTKAPLDTGKLRQSIIARQNKTDKGFVEVALVANSTGLAPYAAYMEFGTGGLVNVPPELQDQAIKFKGKGIRQVNIRPRPYLYPALVEQRGQLLNDLDNLLDTEMKKI